MRLQFARAAVIVSAPGARCVEIFAYLSVGLIEDGEVLGVGKDLENSHRGGVGGIHKKIVLPEFAKQFRRAGHVA